MSPQAREGSYFKSEQEDELSAYRKRRIREGAIAPDPERVLIPGETDPRGRERAWGCGVNSGCGSYARGRRASHAGAEHLGGRYGQGRGAGDGGPRREQAHEGGREEARQARCGDRRGV